MGKYTKINVSKDINELAKTVAAAADRPSVTNLVEHLVKREAKTLGVNWRGAVVKPNLKVNKNRGKNESKPAN